MNFPNHPKSANYCIRGEIVMTADVFRQWKEIRPNANDPRSSIAGIVNAKESLDVEFVHKLKFYAYEILGSGLSPEHQMIYLQQWGFSTPWVFKLDNFNIELGENLLTWRKNNAPYDIDGLVVSNNRYNIFPKNRHNPPYAFGFKVQVRPIVTTVIDVTYNQHKDRTLFPVIHYETIWQGANLNKTSGKTCKFIIENGIGPGAKILISRETIPDIIGVLEPAEPSLPDFDPDDYEWDVYGNFFVLKYDTDEIFGKKIEYFIKHMGISDFAYSRISKLVEMGFKDIRSIIQLSSDVFTDLFGTVMGMKIYNNIHNGIVNVPLYKVMASSGVLGRSISLKRLEALCLKYPDILDYTNLELEKLREKILQIEGFGDFVSTQIAKNLPRFKEWLENIPEITIETQEEMGLLDRMGIMNNNLPQTLAGIKVIVSGFRTNDKNNFQRKVMERGGKYSESLPTKTDAAKTIVVTVEGKKLVNKVEKAREFGIRVYSLEDFEKEFLN